MRIAKAFSLSLTRMLFVKTRKHRIWKNFPRSQFPVLVIRLYLLLCSYGVRFAVSAHARLLSWCERTGLIFWLSSLDTLLVIDSMLWLSNLLLCKSLGLVRSSFSLFMSLIWLMLCQDIRILLVYPRLITESRMRLWIRPRRSNWFLVESDLFFSFHLIGIDFSAVCRGVGASSPMFSVLHSTCQSSWNQPASCSFLAFRHVWLV